MTRLGGAVFALGLLALAPLAAPDGRAAAAAAQPSAARYGVALEEVFIPLPDGVRLAADLFKPTGGAEGERFPVLLEYLPYRKNESRGRNHALYEYFVRRGYVVARVDIRGTGNSEGKLIPYEYSDIENDDGEVVIDWLSRQPFSAGRVGMFGISWGGFNSIHLAMRNPPALEAIIAVDATDDLYQDDVHFMDGVLHVDSWEMSQDLYNLLPGAPDYHIDEQYFADRFDTRPWMLTYKREQRYGPFWKRTTLKERYHSIRVPTFVIGGYYDGYRDSVPRMLQHLKAPVKAIMGPWHHSYPHDAYPKPQIEWRHEAVRWFDHWLKDRDTGILQEPRFAVYIRRYHPPGPVLEEAPGEWRYEDGWPIRRIRERPFYPQPNHTLAEVVPRGVTHRLKNVPSSSIEAGGPVMWFGDVAADQRPTDAFSLVYDSDPVEQEFEILGLPRAILQVAADAPLAQWYVRLCDVAPDGAVTLVASAGQNGAHRESDENPRPLVPGQEFPLEIELHFTSWTFQKGHRLRVAVHNTHWPMLWPSPYPVTTALRLGQGTRVLLPVLPFEQRPRPAFLAPAPDGERLAGYGSLQEETTSGYGEIATVERNVAKRSTRVTALNSGANQYPWGQSRFDEKIVHEVQDERPEAASVRGDYRLDLKLKDRTLTFESQVLFRSDRQSFYYTNTRRLRKDGTLVREKTWEDTIPRDHQ
jgi:predicted acyl esterase